MEVEVRPDKAILKIGSEDTVLQSLLVSLMLFDPRQQQVFIGPDKPLVVTVDFEEEGSAAFSLHNLQDVALVSVIMGVDDQISELVDGFEELRDTTLSAINDELSANATLAELVGDEHQFVGKEAIQHISNVLNVLHTSQDSLPEDVDGFLSPYRSSLIH